MFTDGQPAREISQSNKPHNESDQRWLDKVVGDPVALFTLILTAFTGGLFLATRSLWTSTKDLVQSAERTAENQLRAYVGILSGDVTLELASTTASRVVAKITIKNFGLSPASRVYTSGCIFAAASYVEPETLKNISGGAVIFPSGEQKLTIRANVGVPTTRQTIFLTGMITYTDIFERQRHTCFRLEAHLMTSPNKFGLSACEEGNYAD